MPAFAAVRATTEPQLPTPRVMPGPDGRGYGAKTGMDRRDPCMPDGEAVMTEHPNIELTRQGYDAFAKGDLAALSELIAGDATWHVLGVGPLSGTYHGRDEIFGFFGRLAEETGGTFGWTFMMCSPTTSTPWRCVCCRRRVGTSRSNFRWPTSATSAMAKSPSSGPQQPTRRRASTSGPERTGGLCSKQRRAHAGITSGPSS